MSLTNTSINLAVNTQFATNFGTDTSAIPASITLAAGTALNQADCKYIARRSVVSGTPDVLDLNAGGLLQPDQSAFSIVKLVAIVIVNRNTGTTGVLTVGGGTNAIANISETIGPGGMSVKVEPSLAGIAVTAGTADKLQITSDTGTVSYDILLIGRSA